jgi:hypothetical protein
MLGEGRIITSARRRHTSEQIVRKLREADRLLAEGAEVARHLEISEATYHRWRAQYGGMKADDVKWLKELEAENARLKRITSPTDGGVLGTRPGLCFPRRSGAVGSGVDPSVALVLRKSGYASRGQARLSGPRHTSVSIQLIRVVV